MRRSTLQLRPKSPCVSFVSWTGRLRVMLLMYLASYQHWHSSPGLDSNIRNNEKEEAANFVVLSKYLMKDE